MLYAKIENGSISRYPLYESDIREQFPDVTFPDPFVPPEGYIAVNEVIPKFRSGDQRAQPLPPKNIDGAWYQQWEIVNILPVDQNNYTPLNTPYQVEHVDIDALIRQSVQYTLDSFAQSRGYFDITTACSYSNSTVPKFQQEGQYCVAARDAAWLKCFEILDQINVGIRPTPNKFADIESEFAPLVWPN